MRAVARRSGSRRHEISVRQHTTVSDEPLELDGTDEGPTPLELLAASLAACTAVTIEMYADRKGWDLGEIEVAVEFEPATAGEPTHFDVALHIPVALDGEQLERVQAIAARCPVHRTLEGEVTFAQRLVREPLATQ